MEVLSLEQIKMRYPQEWVLLGNPIIEHTKVLSGIVLFHSKDKKEVCYLGKSLTDGFDRITITFAGERSAMRRIGIMKRV
jgi:hypothetical protein